MDGIDALNRYAEVWARYMGRSLIDVSLVLLIVGILCFASGKRHRLNSAIASFYWFC